MTMKMIVDRTASKISTLVRMIAWITGLSLHLDETPIRSFWKFRASPRMFAVDNSVNRKGQTLESKEIRSQQGQKDEESLLDLMH